METNIDIQDRLSGRHCAGRCRPRMETADVSRGRIHRLPTDRQRNVPANRRTLSWIGNDLPYPDAEPCLPDNSLATHRSLQTDVYSIDSTDAFL